MTGVMLIGTIAATLTTVSFVPQAYRVFKTKQTHDLSLPMYLIFAAGVFLWICYGMLLGSHPVIWANVVTFLLCVAIIIMKLRYK